MIARDPFKGPSLVVRSRRGGGLFALDIESETGHSLAGVLSESSAGNESCEVSVWRYLAANRALNALSTTPTAFFFSSSLTTFKNSSTYRTGVS